MKHYVNILISIVILFALFIFFSGCASPSSRFYTLNPISESGLETKFTEKDNYTIIGVEQVEFPSYLDRPQFIIRQGQNQYQISEFERWAEPINENFERVLIENLNGLLASEPYAVIRLFDSMEIGYLLKISVMRLESGLDGNTSLTVGWSLLNGQGSKVVITKVSRFTEKSDVTDYKGIASAQSRTLGNLSREIAKTIKELK
jgi:uncharacterized lipoprotein YmbA